MEATVILAKCPETGQLYGMRTQKMPDGDWKRTWAFPLSERQANAEGYGRVQITGALRHTDAYPGCPCCRAKRLVQCGQCGRLSCWKKEAQGVCPWCGFSARIRQTPEIRVSGGDM